MRTQGYNQAEADGKDREKSVRNLQLLKCKTSLKGVFQGLECLPVMQLGECPFLQSLGLAHAGSWGCCSCCAQDRKDSSALQMSAGTPECFFRFRSPGSLRQYVSTCFLKRVGRLCSGHGRNFHLAVGHFRKSDCSIPD